MIPYIELEKGNRGIIESNINQIVYNYSVPIMISLLDTHDNVNRFFDVFKESGHVKSCVLGNRQSDEYEFLFLEGKEDYSLRINRVSEDLSNGIILLENKKRYAYDFENQGAVSTLTRFFRESFKLPLNNTIVASVISNIGLESFSSECKSKSIYDNGTSVRVWEIFDEQAFLNGLGDILLEENSKKWNEIESIEDYIYHFADDVKKNISNKIEVLSESNNDYELDKGIELFSGQREIVKGGIEVLNNSEKNYLYLASGMGTGKTIMSLKINDIHMQHKGSKGYSTLIVAPSTTLFQWQKEIEKVVENASVIIIKDTEQFIRIYRDNTEMSFDKPHYFLVGKETLKLDYQKEHAVLERKRVLQIEKTDSMNNNYYERQVQKVCICPNCMQPLKRTMKNGTVKYYELKDFNRVKKDNYNCEECNQTVFQAVYNKTKKTSLVNFIKKHRIYFNSIILDEAHESNNFDSQIGQATRTIMRYADKRILLSGTVSNGYASSIYNLLFMVERDRLVKNDINNYDEFIQKYGTRQARVASLDYNELESKKVTKSQYKEVEGINPTVFTEFMLGNFIFSELEDLRADLPRLIEHEISVKHDSNIFREEERIRAEIANVNHINSKFLDNSIIKSFINKPFNWNEIEVKGKEDKKELIKVNNFKNEELLPKEKELIDLCLNKQEQGEKLWLYLDFINNSRYSEGESISERLERILAEHGVSVYRMKPSTKAVDRSREIEKNKDKFDVFISSPQLIAVGVNLQWCTNYVFYMPSYHVNTVRQAMKRGLRINSTQDNNIYHFFYEQGIEKQIWNRYKLKRAESESIENKFNQVNVERTASNLASSINNSLS